MMGPPRALIAAQWAMPELETPWRGTTEMSMLTTMATCIERTPRAADIRNTVAAAVGNQPVRESRPGQINSGQHAPADSNDSKGFNGAAAAASAAFMVEDDVDDGFPRNFY